MSRPPAPPVAAAVAAECRRRIAAGSRSFALAAGLLPRRSRPAALVVYAWCRRADDAIDRAPPAARPRALAGLHDELEHIARGTATGDPVIDAFGTVASATGMPWHYPREMLAGMRMDLEQAAYDDLGELLHYCYRVAGTVGLMMTHVLTLRDDTALQAAAQLGVAMQITNICRDVLEDWQLGRLYLPRTWLQRSGLGGLPGQLGGPLPRAAREPLRAVVGEMLALAGRCYAGAEAGFIALPWRAAVSIRAARAIYAAIGGRIASTGCDVTAGRAVVPLTGKLTAVLAAAGAAGAELPARLRGAGAAFRPPARVFEFAELDVE